MGNLTELTLFTLNFSIISNTCFRFLKDSNPPKFDGLEAILKNNEEQCLTHKLCKKYFSVKWQEKGCYIYIANLFLYVVFHVFFNLYVALIRGAIADYVEDLMGKQYLVT